MKLSYIYIVFALFFLTNSHCQKILNKQYYNTSDRPFIPPPIEERRNLYEKITKSYCDDLISYAEENGTKKAFVDKLILVNSSWLKAVEYYSINDTNVVIAEIKQDGYNILTKKYIFCDIPGINWNSFYHGLYDPNTTHGERFHKYIKDYICDCK